MSERNRVTPTGEIVAVPARGTWMGNRGVLHDADHRIVRRQRTRAWLICRLEFRGRRVPQWAPNRYTPLFFADEAVALAAGHRPCAECRHAHFVAFRDAAGAASAPVLDARLAAERDGAHRAVPWRDLPDGAFVVVDDRAALVIGDAVRPWDDARYGYDPPVARPRRGRATLLTPATSVAALAAGYPVRLPEKSDPEPVGTES